MVLLLALLLIHWHMVVVLIRRRWLLLLSMMTPRRPHHVRYEHPRFSSFVFLHPIGHDVIFLCLISRERETQKREKKTDQKRDVKVTLMLCLLSSLMPMSTLHISFFSGIMRESIVFFAAECVTFLTDFFFSILLKKFFLSLSLSRKTLPLSLSLV